jgi:hypothetical protein
MRYRTLFPSLVLGAALTMTGCGTDDTVGEYDTVPPATETTTPGMTTDPATTPGVYDDMTTDTATWGVDTAGIATDTGLVNPNP